jgi:hypothetical protein
MADGDRSGRDAEEVLAYVALAVLALSIALALGALFAA